jgi:hypothetical protein
MSSVRIDARLSVRDSWLSLALTVALASCGSGSDSGDSGPAPNPPALESPVRIYAPLNRMPATYTQNELDVMLAHYHVVTGLDGHGEYRDAGHAATLRAARPDLPVLCYASAMDISTAKPEFSIVDPHEDLFWHSADPASLRVGRAAAGDIVWFRRDRRASRTGGVAGYLVEKAASAAGPWQSVGGLIPDTSSEFYSVAVDTAAAASAAVYRVRVQMADTSTRLYSGVVAPVDIGNLFLTAAGFVIPEPVTAPTADIGFEARCYGTQCPASAADIHLAIDLNNNRQYGTAMCGTDAQRVPLAADIASGCERFAFSAAGTTGDGSRRYTQTLRLPVSTPPRSYRVVLAGDAGITAHNAGESYQSFPYNNRLVMPDFYAQLLHAADARWIGVQRDRLQACRARGYSGMRFDFALTTLDPTWIASGLPPDWQPGDTRVRNETVEMFTALRAADPTAHLTFNGLFVDVAPYAGFDNLLQTTSGGDIEYFAFRVNASGDTERSSAGAIRDALEGMLRAGTAGRWAVALSAGRENDTVARLTSLALYLLVSGPDSYYYYSTDIAYQSVELYPEWSLPLGAPASQPASLAELESATVPRLFERRFDGGVVYANLGTSATNVDLGTTGYVVALSGGRSPQLGGAGTMSTSAATTIPLDPGAAAIVLWRALE